MIDSSDDLLHRVAHWPHDGSLADLTPGRLRSIAAAEGIDFATTLLYDRIVRSPECGPAIEWLNSLSEVPAEPFPQDATLVIAPGAFHVEFPHTGADGHLLRDEAARFGLRSDMIPVPTFGPLADNARAICDWLIRRPPDERIVLASLSKGGADVKVALTRSDAAQAFRNVAVWLDLSGLQSGTPLVGWLLARRWRTLAVRLLFWWRRFDFDVVRDLDSGAGTPLDFPLRLPDHMQAIHVVGFPLARDLTNRLSRRCFRRIRDLGPNDGAGIMLGEAARWPGIIYPLWGADHYLRPAGRDIRPLARRLLAAAQNILSSEMRQTPRNRRCVPCSAGKDVP